MLPSEYASLNRKDKAFVIAAVQIRTEEEEREAKKARKGR